MESRLKVREPETPGSRVEIPLLDVTDPAARFRNLRWREAGPRPSHSRRVSERGKRGQRGRACPRGPESSGWGWAERTAQRGAVEAREPRPAGPRERRGGGLGAECRRREGAGGCPALRLNFPVGRRPSAPPRRSSRPRSPLGAHPPDCPLALSLRFFFLLRRRGFCGYFFPVSPVLTSPPLLRVVLPPVLPVKCLTAPTSTARLLLSPIAVSSSLLPFKGVEGFSSANFWHRELALNLFADRYHIFHLNFPLNHSTWINLCRSRASWDRLMGGSFYITKIRLCLPLRGGDTWGGL